MMEGCPECVCCRPYNKHAKKQLHTRCVFTAAQPAYNFSLTVVPPWSVQYTWPGASRRALVCSLCDASPRSSKHARRPTFSYSTVTIRLASICPYEYTYHVSLEGKPVSYWFKYSSSWSDNIIAHAYAAEHQVSLRGGEYIWLVQVR